MTQLQIPEPTELDKLQAQLTEAMKAMVSITAQHTTLTESRQAITDEVAEVRKAYQDKVNELAAVGHEIDNALWEVRKQKKAVEQTLNSVQRQVEQLKRNQIASENFKVLEEKWLLATAGAPWREMSFEHQIDGAKWMVYHRSGILADVMGLGKTLTAIMAMDMIRAETANASPENPKIYECH